jgi:NADH-quinone oxidoreductase subunit J
LILSAMVAQNIAFYAVAAMIVFSAFRVVTTRNVVHAAMWLVLVLSGVAAQYVLLAAEFVAATQVLVYIGAIIVLFLFGIMLTRAQLGEDQRLTHDYWYVGAFTALLLFAVMSYALVDEWGWSRTKMPADTRLAVVEGSNTKTVADSLFAEFLIPFQAVGVLLTAALVGAIVLARRERA